MSQFFFLIRMWLLPRHVKVNFEKKSAPSCSEISVSCTSQKHDIVATPCYPFFRSIIEWSLTEVKTKENFKLLALKVVAATYERWSVTIGSKNSDLTWKLLKFWKTGR